MLTLTDQGYSFYSVWRAPEFGQPWAWKDSMVCKVEKFFPRSFDMNNPHDAEDFEAEYKVTESGKNLKWVDGRKAIPKV